MITGVGPYKTAIPELQAMLSDQGDDRYVHRHKCFGVLNGDNLLFKTFFRRRVTDLTNDFDDGQGVFVNDVLIPASSIAADNLETGEFSFVSSAAPNDGDNVEASYYYQWFDPNELDTFLQIASRWLNSTSDYTTTNIAMQDAVLKYAAGLAYQKMAQRWRTYMSQEYRVEDAPKDSPTYNTNDFLSLAKTYRAEALASRTEYYETRQGRALQPLSGTVRGRVRNV